MSCIIIYNKDNGVGGMRTPSGASSTLYPALLERTKDVQNAVELTTMTHTAGFIDRVVQPILSKYASEVRNRLNTLKPKNSNLQLVYRGKEYTVDIENLQYKVVLTKGFETIQAYAQVGEEKVMLGKVRLKAYKEGMAIESTSLTAVNVYVEGNLESLQGKGIGTEIYKKAINHTLKQGKPFYSDANQTQAAAGVWEKLKATKLVGKEDGRNKIEAYPPSHFDKNKELLPKVVINYVLAKQAEGKQLTFEQKQDVRNALLNSEFKDSQQMSDALQRVFFKDGEFVVEEKRLKEHYNSYEIANILSNKDLQKKIRNTLEALKNTQEVLVSNVYFTEEFLNKSSKINSLGKMVINNPLLTEQLVIQELGGVSDEREFKEKVENLELELIIGDTSIQQKVNEDRFTHKTIETVTPGMSSNYANMTEDGQGNFVFYHSSEEKREFIDPKKYKSNKNNITSSLEAAAIAKVGGVSMYYTDPTDTENGIGAVKHAVKVPKSEVYDFNSDQLGLIDIAKQRFNAEYPGHAFDANTQLAYVTKVAGDYGYKMVVAEWAGKSRAQSIHELTPFDAQETVGNVISKPFQEKYTGNREKGYRSIIPQSKEDILKGIYLAMNQELGSKGIYGALYHMHYNYVNNTQEEITKLVEEATVSQELKDEYYKAVEYQQENRSSSRSIASLYKERANEVKKQDPKQYWSFDIPSDSQIEEAATNGRIVDVAGGMGIVTEDGNMIGMFKYNKSAKGTAAAVQAARIAKGGVKLDNFDGYLTKLYEKNGFRVVSRVPFNEEYAPEDWNKEAHGTPDVVAMVYDPNHKLDIIEKTFDDYDTAMAYRETYAEQVASNNIQFQVKETVDPKDVIYHGMMVADPQALEEAFPAVHPNKFYHHSTVAFRPQDTSNIEVGKAQELKVTGRITTDKVDALLVENPKSANKDAHITLSTAEGIKPFEVNKEIENNREKITAVPEGTTVQATEGYFNGKEDVTSVKDKGPFSAVIEKLKETGLANNIYSLSNQEIQNKLSELGVGDTVSKQLANGVKVTAAGFTYKGDVYLNTDTMTLDTPIHEMGHLYLNMLRAGGKDTYEVLVKGMNLAKSKEAEAYRNHVKKYQPKLKEGTPEFYEEVLAQAIGDAGAKFLEGTKKDSFTDWLEEMWDSFKDIMGMSDYMKDKNGKNKHFKNITFGQFTQAIARDLFDHQTIEGLMASLPYASEGVLLKVKDDPKFSDSKGIDLEAYGVDFIDTTLPVRSLDSVVSEYKGKVFFTTSDCTGVGYDSEGFPIQGGPGYTAIKKNVEDNIGFAALNDKGSEAFETRVMNIFGPGVKVAVMVMAQTPSSTLGNVYGGRYLGRALKELKAKLAPAEFKEALASIDNIILTNKKIIDSINAFEKSAKGYPLRKPLLELLHNADNYTSEEFAQAFIKDTTFDIRRELMQIIFLKDSQTAMDVSTHKIKRSLAEAGFNAYNFLKEFGDKTFLTDSLIKNDKGGMVLAGFEFITAKNKAEVKTRVAATAGRGVKHEQFNGKLASNGGAFVLDGAYDIENNFVSAAEVETQLNPEYTEEIDKEFKKYAKKHRPIVEAVEGISATEKKRFETYLKKEGLTNTTEAKRKDAFKDYAKANKIVAKEYKYMPTKHRIDFKKVAGIANPNLLLVSVPSLQAAVARGVGFAITKEGQAELTNRTTPKFSIAGIIGATELDLQDGDGRNIRQDKKKLAEQMESVNETAKTIKYTTGWERGVDNQWRYELPDVDFKSQIKDYNGIPQSISEIMEQATKGVRYDFKLSDLVEENDLLKAYPNLGKVKVIFATEFIIDKEDALGTAEGFARILDGEHIIVIRGNSASMRTEKALRSTLVHEVQHVVQNFEGFARGGNSTSAFVNLGLTEQVGEDTLIDGDKAMNYIRKESDRVREVGFNLKEELQQKGFDLRSGWAPDSNPTELEEALAKELEEAAQSMYYLKEWAKDPYSYDYSSLYYFRLAGEVESRNASRRMEFSESERQKHLLSQTEEVSRAYQEIAYEENQLPSKSMSLFQKMQDFKRMPEMKIEGEELKQVDKNDTKTTLEQTFTVDNGYDLSQDIIYLNTLSQDLYEENPEEVQGLLEEIEKKAARQGVDIIGISEKVFSKSRDEIYDLLEDLNTLVAEPSQENLEAFAKSYDVLFEVRPDVSDKVLKVGEGNLKKALVHLNSKESEYQLFAKHSLIKVAENVYQKVEKSEDLNDLYDKLYQVAQYNERVLPLEAFPLANEGGALNLSTIRKAENKEILVKDIQTFVENKVTALDLSDTMTENSLLQQMVAFKYFFNNPMVFKNSISLQEEFDNYNSFDGSEAYLTTDFISDFYSDFLKEKIKGSDLFQNFYSHFSVNDKGIKIDSDDIITLTKIQDYLDSGSVRGAKDLRNYSLLSTQLPNLKKAVETNMEYTREFKRALYTNTPRALDRFSQNYSKLSNSAISVKGSTEEFVRIKTGVYELIEQNNGIGYYEKLEENVGDYKTFKVEEPTLSVDSSAYGSLEVGAVQKAVEAKKYYSKQEESKIDDQNFDCL